MAEFDKPQEELLKEARRTTHAVRAIARFFLLIVTYEVFAAVFIGLGLAVSDSRSFDAGMGFVLIGFLLAVVGLIHALVAGHSELGQSDRTKHTPQPSSALSVDEMPRDENGLLEGICSCTGWERQGATAVKNGVKYCTRCERVIPV